MSLEQLYEQACTTYSDIYEHVPTLYKYAKECLSVAEFGVRSGVSTFGFFMGLADREGAKYYGLDLTYCPVTEKMSEIAKQRGIDYTFVKGDSVKVDLPYEFDIVFIDTWHVYGHLKRELAKHHSKASKYILLHDTTVDADVGESIRCGLNVMRQAQQSGYPVHEITKGLWPAVTEFLEEHKDEWELLERFTNNNGLTVLKRK